MADVLTSRQLWMWAVLFNIGSAILVLPSTLANIAEEDAWLSVILAIGLYLLLIPLYSGIAKQMNGDSMTQYAVRLFGNWLGKFQLLTFIFFYPFLTSIMTLRNLSDFESSNILIETPTIVISAITMTVVCYGVYHHSKTSALGRAAELSLPIVLFFIFILLSSQLPNTQIGNVKPFLSHGFLPILDGALQLLAFPFLNNILILFFMPWLQDAKKLSNVLWKTGIISGSIFLCLTLTVITVMNAKMTSTVIYASHFSAKLVNIGDFFERIESVISVSWYICVFFRMGLLVFVTIHTLAQIMKIQRLHALLIPMLIIVLVLSSIVWNNNAEWIQSFSVSPIYACFFAIMMPLIWLCSGMIRKQVNGGSQQ
ncbi:GerAB/ArcD/ProY family transporter [Paenibacillus sp. strain BS8-2]